MTIRLLCDARGAHRKRFMERMLALSDGKVELAIHMGDRDADWHAPSLSRMEVRRGRRGAFMQGQHQTGANMALIASPGFAASLETAVDQMHRSAPAYRYRAHNLQNMQDYLDYFHILSDVFAQRMLDEGVTHVLFYNVPHLTYDMVMYQVAQALGIRTIVLCQTIFPNRYFSMSRIEDYGDFDPAGSDAPPYSIEKGSAPDLFYMKDNWQKPGQPGKLTVRGVGQLVQYMARKDPAKLLNPAFIARTVRRMNAIYRRFPDWRDPFANFFHVNELAYFEHLAEFEGSEIDLSLPFIYVPLHNQPEMSTSSLGGIYRDQALMIEALARDLPEGWKIYVKENPRQGAYARGPMFFHRLARIPAVQFMPSYANTAALAANARFTATVTGTAGWEAIRKGRPAMVFGQAWYGALPGVVRYAPGLDFEAIAAMQIDHAALERAAGALMARAHQGIIEEVYFNMVEGYDVEANADAVARTTLDLLTGAARPSFGT